MSRRRALCEQRVELVELRLQGVIARKSSSTLDLADGRIKGAIGVLRRAEIAQTDVPLGSDGFEQRCSKSRLANARLTGEQHHLALTGLCLRPAPQQQFKFFLSTDKIGQTTAMQCLKTACRRALSQRCPSAHRACNSLEVLCPQILEFKQIAEKPSCALSDNHGVWLGDSLELRGNVRSLADDAALLRASRIGHRRRRPRGRWQFRPSFAAAWASSAQPPSRPIQAPRELRARGRPRALQDNQNKLRRRSRSVWATSPLCRPIVSTTQL